MSCLLSTTSSASTYEEALYEFNRKNFVGAFRMMKPLAKAGNLDAQFHIASGYTEGRGVPANTKEAFHWFRSAAEGGHLGAIYRLGIMHVQGEFVDRDYDKALLWFKKGMEKDHVSSISMMGYMYQKGFGVDKSPQISANYIEKAANLGDLQSQLVIATKYLKGGLGVEKDLKKSFSWFKKIAENQGHRYAKYQVGKMYIAGVVTTKDTAKGMEYVLSAANSRLEVAQEEIARIYYKGEIVEKDLKTALMYALLSSGDIGSNELSDEIAKHLSQREREDVDHLMFEWKETYGPSGW